jgi:predicted MFS family arabinose efflux permease
VWADRLPRHRVMVVSDVVRAGLHGVLAALILSGTAEVWHVVVIEALYGAAHAFFRPAYTGLVPQTVPEDLVQEANAVNFLSNNVASFTGPALAALLVVTVGAGAAFVIDSLTFVVSAWLLLQVRPRERGARTVERRPLLTELGEGFREVRARPWVGLTISSASLALMIAFSPFQALGPAIADDVYGQAAIFGVVSAMFGVGAILGSALALRWRPEHPLFYGTLACVPWSLNFLAYAAGLSLPLMIPFALASGAGISLFMVWWETALATGVPPEALSRVSSFDWMGSLGLAPVGLILAGPIAASIGEQETLAIGAAAATLVTFAVAWTAPIRHLRQPNSGTPLSGVEASA